MGVFTKITVLFDAILICTVVLVALFIGGRFMSVIKEQEIQLGNRRIDEIGSYMQEKYNRVYSLANYMHSSRITEILADIKDDEEKYYDMNNINFMSVFFEGVYSADNEFSDVIIATMAGRTYSFTAKGNSEVDSRYPFMEADIVKEFVASDENIKIFYGNPSAYCLKAREPVITFMGKIYDASLFPKRELVGLYIMNVPVENIKKFAASEDSKKRALIMITNKDHQVLCCNDESLCGTFVSIDDDNEDVYTIKRNVASNGISVIYKIPKSMLYYEFSQIRDPIILVCLIAIAITLVIVGRIRKIYADRINALVSQMEHVETGDFGVRLEDEGNDEIAMLSSSFNKMCERLDSYISMVYETELQRKNAEINALQMQINPHFLYNTLESIKAEAVKEGNRKTPEMIVLLGNLFRWACHTDEKYVTIEEELDYVNTYLRLQSFRYDEVLDIDVSVREEELDYAIPKLTLQPIVENVIKHGLVGINRRGIVGIIIKKVENNLEITVYDNGQGMNEETLNTLREKLSGEIKQEEFSSIGIQNVHNRLRLLFGSGYGLMVSSILNMGTAVKVIIPAQSCEEMEIHVQAIDSRR